MAHCSLPKSLPSGRLSLIRTPFLSICQHQKTVPWHGRGGRSSAHRLRMGDPAARSVPTSAEPWPGPGQPGAGARLRHAVPLLVRHLGRLLQVRHRRGEVGEMLRETRRRMRDARLGGCAFPGMHRTGTQNIPSPSPSVSLDDKLKNNSQKKTTAHSAVHARVMLHAAWMDALPFTAHQSALERTSAALFPGAT